MAKFQDKLIADGYCDNRGAGFCATATELPKGEYDIVALCVNGNKLNLFDVDMKSNIGELLYEVDLKKIENLKMDQKQSELWSEMLQHKEQQLYQIGKLAESSYTMIAFPVPAIGDKFEEIFHKNVI